MKLRCTHNSLRIRVRKSDLDTLRQQKIVSESVQFSPQTTLTFSLQIVADSTQVSATLQQNDITVYLPANIANTWINTSQVGIEVHQELPETAQHLHVLIEKDFPCNDREEEDKADTFWELAKDPENPNIC
ncbi:DUF7009 family protein [Microscilla marina]|uniref:DUF7009 family protein n=1 Tax=Microscilla marina TaxID=1027 RepID=UPI000313A042|nr:hypothetical protein [Microscilla marina]